MKNNDVIGLLFANVRDRNLESLTSLRAAASVPFGARYRLIDFALSNLVNAGINKVGVITANNYRSLMDHIGSGKPWDLDRKAGGLFILPPYSTYDVGSYHGSVGALGGAMTFLRRCKEKYVVLCDANIVINIDIKQIVKEHIKSGRDITVCYKNGDMPANNLNLLALNVEASGEISQICFCEEGTPNQNYAIGIFVMDRELLMKLTVDAINKNLKHFSRDIIMANHGSLSMNGYKIESYAQLMASQNSYVKASMDLLRPEVRRDLFVKDRPVYTKSRDNMPTRYGVAAKVNQSLIGEGCVIAGEVKNCIIFRDVIVEEGAVLENCILMQGTKIGKNAKLKFIVADKNTTISEGVEMSGAPEYYSFIKKDAKI